MPATEPDCRKQNRSLVGGPDKASRKQTVSVFGRNLAQNNDTLRSYVYVKASGRWRPVGQCNPSKPIPGRFYGTSWFG